MRGAALVVLVAIVGVPAAAAQRPGDLDPSWGRGGIARTLVTQGAPRVDLIHLSALRVWGGKLVVAGQATVARPTP